jgi:hypothetical protein
VGQNRAWGTIDALCYKVIASALLMVICAGGATHAGASHPVQTMMSTHTPVVHKGGTRIISNRERVSWRDAFSCGNRHTFAYRRGPDRSRAALRGCFRTPRPPCQHMSASLTHARTHTLHAQIKNTSYEHPPSAAYLAAIATMLSEAGHNTTVTINHVRPDDGSVLTTGSWSPQGGLVAAASK